jgi:hypothetical protein
MGVLGRLLEMLDFDGDERRGRRHRGDRDVELRRDRDDDDHRDWDDDDREDRSRNRRRDNPLDDLFE